jgi:DNA-binding CsgD family transcriptional regulator
MSVVCESSSVPHSHHPPAAKVRRSPGEQAEHGIPSHRGGDSGPAGRHPCCRDSERLLALLAVLVGQADPCAVAEQVARMIREWSGFDRVFLRIAPDTTVEGAGAAALAALDSHHPDCPCTAVMADDSGIPSPPTPDRPSFVAATAREIQARIPNTSGSFTRCRGCANDGCESMAIVPLRSAGGPLGVIQLQSRRPGVLDPRIARFLEVAAPHIAAGLVSASRMAALERRIRQVAALVSETDRPRQSQPRSESAATLGAFAALSAREIDVLRLLVRNRRPAAIARDLRRSIHTVRNHLKAIYRKLDLHSQADLVAFVEASPARSALLRPRAPHASGAQTRGAAQRGFETLFIGIRDSRN